MKKLLSIYYTNRRLGLRSRRCTFYEKSTIGEIGYLQGNDQGTAHDACLLVGCPHEERHRTTCHGHNHQAANLVGLLRATLQSKTVDNRKDTRAAEADAQQRIGCKRHRTVVMNEWQSHADNGNETSQRPRRHSRWRCPRCRRTPSRRNQTGRAVPPKQNFSFSYRFTFLLFPRLSSRHRASHGYSCDHGTRRRSRTWHLSTFLPSS